MYGVPFKPKRPLPLGTSQIPVGSPSSVKGSDKQGRWGNVEAGGMKQGPNSTGLCPACWKGGGLQEYQGLWCQVSLPCWFFERRACCPEVPPPLTGASSLLVRGFDSRRHLEVQGIH